MKRVLKHFLFLLLLLTGLPSLSAQEKKLYGRVVDGDEDPMPYVNVFVKPLGSNGTTSNEKGRFELRVDLSESDSIFFRYTGYREQGYALGDVENPIRVELEERNLLMKATTITDDKDPGERIMDSVRAHRDEYLDGIGGYGAKFYMKGRAYLDSTSEGSMVSIQVQGRELDSSEMLYLTESMSRFRYHPPDRIQEEMISSRVSGNPEGFSSNRASQLLKNPYLHRIELPGVSKRDFISPVGRSAPAYYEFDWTGAYQKDGMTISRIRVIPKREHDPVFTGTLEVVEKDWRIKALDLKGPSTAPLEFVDSLRIKQEYVEWKEEEWLPLSLEESYWFNMMGIAASYSMVGHCSEHEALGKAPDESPRIRFRVSDTALQQDTAYWRKERPYVLKEEETEHYQRSDSLHEVRTSKPYLDSIDSVQNRLEVSDILWGGYDHQNSIDSSYWSLNSLASAVGFNTVEGWRFRFRPSYKKELAGGRSRSFALEARYGVSSQNPYLKGRMSFQTDPFHSEAWHFEGGVTLRETNRTEPVPEWLNSIYSLTRERNYLKLYRSRFFEAMVRREWSNGFYAGVELGWEDRSIPSNRTSQTWFPREELDYTPNRFPRALENPSKVLRAQVDWTLWPAQRYEEHPNEKWVVGTPYPELYGELEGAVPLGDDWAAYGRVELGVGEHIDMGLGGVMRVDLYGGDFLYKEALSIMDRKQFRGNRTLLMHSIEEGIGHDPWGSHRLRSFQTLPYYARFTKGRYGGAHVYHRFQGALLNKLPLIRKTNVHILVGGNGLYTQGQGAYAEIYAGVENILKLLRVDLVFAAYPRFETRPYWRVGITGNLF